MDLPNGKHDIITALEKQDSKLENLEEVMEKGFKSVVNELKEMRTALLSAATGIPVSVFVTVVRTLCWLLGALTVWFTGLKAMFPDAF